MKTEQNFSTMAWQKFIRCPRCHRHPMVEVQSLKEKGQCLSCGQSWKWEENTFIWDDADAVKSKTKWPTIVKKLKNQFNPLSNYLLPFRWINDFRTKKFYRRTLNDRTLAAKWHQHYLSNVQLSPGDIVLDYGCGGGRITGLSTQCGFYTLGQDVQKNSWWKKLVKSGFQVVPPQYSAFPWQNQTFSAVLSFEVLHYLEEEKLYNHIREILRILKPGGYAIFLEANSESYGANLNRKYCGRLHSIEFIRQMCSSIGFEEISLSYEGFYSPIFPLCINFIRKQCSIKPFDMFDFDTFIQSILPPKKRALCLIKLRKPLSSSLA